MMLLIRKQVILLFFTCSSFVQGMSAANYNQREQDSKDTDIKYSSLASCGSNEDCNYRGTCAGGLCTCNYGLIGDKCETILDCTSDGKFRGCSSSGGKCTHDGTNSMCMCPVNGKYHDTEHICKATCSRNGDCYNGGTCVDDFCTCNKGLFGDKCEIIFDCTSEGKFRGCASSGGKCNHDGTNAVCICPENQKYHITEHICKATCSNNDDCNDYQTCKETKGYKTCVCADGLSGKYCEKKYWCEDNGNFGNCKGENGTCTYSKYKRSIDCICDAGKALYPPENRCKATCNSDEDCKHGGRCVNNFCYCRPGIIGDKCETVFDCTPKGKFKGCVSSGGTCTHDGSHSVCTCPKLKRFHVTELICKGKDYCTSAPCKNNGICINESNGTYACLCRNGYLGTNCELECDCGLHSRSCRVSSRGKKLCDCEPGYVQKNGTCADICGSAKCLFGKCEVFGNTYRCKCEEGFSGVLCDISSNIETNMYILAISLVVFCFILLSTLIGIICWGYKIIRSDTGENSKHLIIQ